LSRLRKSQHALEVRSKSEVETMQRINRTLKKHDNRLLAVKAFKTLISAHNRVLDKIKTWISLIVTIQCKKIFAHAARIKRRKRLAENLKFFCVFSCLKYNDYKLQEGLFETRKLNEIKHAIVMKGRFSNKVSQPRRAKSYLLNFLREIQHMAKLEQKSAHYVSNVFKIQ